LRTNRSDDCTESRRPRHAAKQFAASCVFVTLAILAFVPASDASLTIVGRICFDTGSGGCLVPGGPCVVEDDSQVWTLQNANPPYCGWRWDETKLGTVTAASPFSDHAFDQRFLGDSVVRFAGHANPAFCIQDRVDPYSGGEREAVLWQCNSQPDQYYVEDAHRLINVAATDTQGTVYELSNDPNGLGGQFGSVWDWPPAPDLVGDQRWCLDQGSTDCIGP
jgi:hypothetical protein